MYTKPHGTKLHAALLKITLSPRWVARHSGEPAIQASSLALNPLKDYFFFLFFNDFSCLHSPYPCLALSLLLAKAWRVYSQMKKPWRKKKHFEESKWSRSQVKLNKHPRIHIWDPFLPCLCLCRTGNVHSSQHFAMENMTSSASGGWHRPRVRDEARGIWLRLCHLEGIRWQRIQLTCLRAGPLQITLTDYSAHNAMGLKIIRKKH